MALLGQISKNIFKTPFMPALLNLNYNQQYLSNLPSKVINCPCGMEKEFNSTFFELLVGVSKSGSTTSKEQQIILLRHSGVSLEWVFAVTFGLFFLSVCINCALKSELHDFRWSNMKAFH